MFSKFKAFEGPAKFVWRDPDTDRKFEEPSKAALIERIKQYRQQNNLEEIEHLPVVLENYWCGRPENKGKCIPAKLERGFLGWWKGGIALIRQMAYRRFAPQVVADRRSKICAKCPYNVFPDRDGFIRWSDDIAEQTTLGRKAALHDSLGACEVCSCPLRAKVWIDETIPLKKRWVGVMQQVGCWQLEVGKVEDGD